MTLSPFLNSVMPPRPFGLELAAAGGALRITAGDAAATRGLLLGGAPAGRVLGQVVRADLVVRLRRVAQRAVVGDQVRGRNPVGAVGCGSAGVAAVALQLAPGEQRVEREEAEHEDGEDGDRDRVLGARERACRDREDGEQHRREHEDQKAWA